MLWFGCVLLCGWRVDVFGVMVLCCCVLFGVRVDGLGLFWLVVLSCCV